MCRYDLDDMDIFWLQEVNEELAEMGENVGNYNVCFRDLYATFFLSKYSGSS